MKALMAGEQGRAWLTRGALRDAPIARRFDRYVDAMATDASRFVGQKTWRRFWGADNELVCLATKLRVAMVCVETATKTHGAFLAVPPDVAETGQKSTLDCIYEYSLRASALAPTDSQHHDPATTFMARTHQQQSFLPRDGAWHQLVKPRVLGCVA